MAKYDMTKKALVMGLYNQTELIKLRDITLDSYLASGDLTQVEYDELMGMVIVAIGV